MSENNDAKHVLLVLTSHSDLGGVRPTGFYVDEAAHPWQVFRRMGFTVGLASIAGGVPPQDGRHPGDPVQEQFLHDADISRQLVNTHALAQVNANRYDAVLFVGGHGVMWDFPNNSAVNAVGRNIWERGGIVAAVCHGPAALVDMTLSDGSYLIAGRQVTGFTNGEEQNLGRYPWLRRANRREIEIEAGEMPGASPASRLREILVLVRKSAAFDEQESPAQLLQFVELMAGDEHGDAAVGSPLSEHGDELGTPSGSRPTSGSSRIRNSGSLTSAMANARHCFMPNEKPAGLRSRYGQSPTSSGTGRILRS